MGGSLPPESVDHLLCIALAKLDLRIMVEVQVPPRICRILNEPIGGDHVRVADDAR